MCSVRFCLHTQVSLSCQHSDIISDLTNAILIKCWHHCFSYILLLTHIGIKNYISPHSSFTTYLLDGCYFELLVFWTFNSRLARTQIFGSPGHKPCTLAIFLLKAQWWGTLPIQRSRVFHLPASVTFRRVTFLGFCKMQIASPTWRVSATAVLSCNISNEFYFCKGSLLWILSCLLSGIG